MLSLLTACASPIAAQARPHDLVIAAKGDSRAVILVSGTAGPWDKRAATDLRHYIGVMTGAEPDLRVDAPASSSQTAIVIGQAALVADPSVAGMLARTAKVNPVVQADAIASGA